MKAIIRASLFLGVFVGVVWLILRLLLPWLSYPRIVMAGALMFFAGGALVLARAVLGGSYPDESHRKKNKLVLQGGFYLAVGVVWLLVGKFLMHLW
jgi:hypothetical protein